MDIDITIIIQFFILVGVLFALNAIVLRPFQGVLEARMQAREVRRARAQELHEKALVFKEKYETFMNDARHRAMRERQNLRAEGQREERRILDDVRSEISSELSEAREVTQRSKVRASARLEHDVDALARQLVEQLLGRSLIS